MVGVCIIFIAFQCTLILTGTESESKADVEVVCGRHATPEAQHDPHFVTTGALVIVRSNWLICDEQLVAHGIPFTRKDRRDLSTFRFVTPTVAGELHLRL